MCSSNLQHVHVYDIGLWFATGFFQRSLEANQSHSHFQHCWYYVYSLTLIGSTHFIFKGIIGIDNLGWWPFFVVFTTVLSLMVSSH